MQRWLCTFYLHDPYNPEKDIEGDIVLEWQEYIFARGRNEVEAVLVTKKKIWLSHYQDFHYISSTAGVA